MAYVIHSAMAFICTALVQKNFSPLTKHIQSIFIINADTMDKITNHIRRISSQLKPDTYQPTPYFLEITGKLLKDTNFNLHTNTAKLKYGELTLALYYNLVITLWDGLIIDRSLRRFLSIYNTLPPTQSFHDSVTTIDNILQPLAYINNKSNFGRKFKIFKKLFTSLLQEPPTLI